MVEISNFSITKPDYKKSFETYCAKESLHFLTVCNVGGHELWRVHFLPDNLLPLHWLCRFWLGQGWFGRFWLVIVRRCPCRSFIDFCYCLKMWQVVQHGYQSKWWWPGSWYCDFKSDLHSCCSMSTTKTGHSGKSHTISIWKHILLHKS